MHAFVTIIKATQQYSRYRLNTLRHKSMIWHDAQKRTKTLIKHCHCIAAPNGKPSSTSGLETAMHDDDCDYAVENKWRSNGTRRKLKISQLLARRVSAWRFCGGHYYLRAKKPNLLSHPFWKWRFFFSTFCSGSGQCFFFCWNKGVFFGG